MLKMFRNDIHRFVFALTLGLFLAIGISVWATSVGTNLSVTGTATVSSTLDVTGATTFNGNVTLGDAATDINLFTGTLQASTTALFTSGLTTYGNSTFGDAATDINLFTGLLNASSTLAVTGVSNFYNNLQVNGFATTTSSNGNIKTEGFVHASSTLTVTGVTRLYNDLQVNGYATTTSSNGNMATNGTLGVATSTPGQDFSVGGDALIQNSSGTTTLIINTEAANTGSCIQLRGANGTTFRVYAGATSTSGYLVVQQGSCQ